MTKFKTITEATKYIETALGKFAKDYDIEAMANDHTEWQDGELIFDFEEEELYEIAKDYDKNLVVRYLVTDRAEIDFDGEEHDTIEDAKAAAWDGAEVYKCVYDTNGCYPEGNYGELVEQKKVL